MADDLISRQTIGRSGSMTNEEAIKLLSQIKDVLLASNSWLPSTHNPIKESFGMAINALTAQEKAQEVSNNSPELDKENGKLISRKAAIDACLELLETRRKWDTAEGRAEMRGINPVMCAIHDLPSAQPEQRWIPVKAHPATDEERESRPDIDYWLDCEMPDDGQEILVTVKHKDWIGVEKDVCYVDSDYSLDSGYDWLDDIIAWMPLPEPYAERRTDDLQ